MYMCTHSHYCIVTRYSKYLSTDFQNQLRITQLEGVKYWLHRKLLPPLALYGLLHSFDLYN